jgi:hypothetical protein
MSPIWKGAFLVGYGVTILLATRDLWHLRGSEDPRAKSKRMETWGLIILMTVLPVWLFEGLMSTAVVGIVLLVVLVPGLWLYLRPMRR